MELQRNVFIVSLSGALLVLGEPYLRALLDKYSLTTIKELQRTHTDENIWWWAFFTELGSAESYAV
jgi:hypothetical protein